MKSISSGDGVFWIEPPLLPRGSRCLFWRLFILLRCLLKLRLRRGVTRGLPSPREGRRPRCGDRASGSRGRWCSLLTPRAGCLPQRAAGRRGPGRGRPPSETGLGLRVAGCFALRAPSWAQGRPAHGRPLDGDGGRGPQSRGLDARSSRGTEPWAPRPRLPLSLALLGNHERGPWRPPVSAPRVRAPCPPAVPGCRAKRVSTSLFLLAPFPF